jgi:AcrR family transcriptional regulator
MITLLHEVNKDETISYMKEDTAPKGARPRQQRAIETRASLLAAVETIVAEEGTQAVTTTRVASDTGVAVGTIYRYFADRDAMLLAAYDTTVARLIDTCHAALENLPDETPVEAAAQHLLGVYLEAAEATPAHAGLLATMRLLRPIEVDRSSTGDRVITDLVAPFFERFTREAKVNPLQLQLLGAALGTMVDLYLVAPTQADRALVRVETEAFLLFMVERIVKES